MFTKALRRKDMAGASAEDDEKTSEDKKVRLSADPRLLFDHTTDAYDL